MRLTAISLLSFDSTVLSQIASFGRMVGQSFEAQSLIAMVNTLLTTTGRSAFF